MSTYAVSQPLAIRRTLAGPLRFVPAALVFAAVVFNALLAVINGHVTALSPAAVVGAELALVAAAHGLALANYRPQMLPWYVLMAALLLLACYRALVLEQFEPKYLRDVLLIPTFIVLGMTFDPRGLTRLVVLVHATVLAVLVFEAIDPSAYATVFRVQDYYINTRGYVAESFWNKESELYVSAIRPDSRIFSFIDLHRLSSIFLEPVSLGNYCIVIVAFLCAHFRRLDSATRWFLAVGTIVALIGSDGRLAAGTSVLIIVAALLARRLPPHAAFLYLPAVTAGTFMVVLAAGLHAGSDDFAGRIAHTVDLIRRFDVAAFLGLSNDPVLLAQAVDSGLGYLILTQSLVGIALVWSFVALGLAERTIEQARYKHAACIYLSLSMIVSFAFLSIKTAALLWFIAGALHSLRAHTGIAPRPQARSSRRPHALRTAGTTMPVAPSVVQRN